MKKRAWLYILLLILAAGGITAAIMWNKPHRKAEDEKGIPVTAVALYHEFATNEAASNAKYLNKPVEVTGKVASLDTNQDGQVAVVLQSDDLMYGVMCTMRDKQAKVAAGSTVTLKGFCSGFVSDVKLTDCILRQ